MLSFIALFELMISAIIFIWMPIEMYMTAGVFVAISLAVIFGRWKKVTGDLESKKRWIYLFVFVWDTLFWAGAMIQHIKSTYELADE